MIKHLIFDIDGTLINDTNGWESIDDKLLIPEFLKLGKFTSEEYKKAKDTAFDEFINGKQPLYSNPLRYLINQIAKELNVQFKEGDEDRIIAAILQHLFENELIFDGALGMIPNLAKNYDLYIISNRKHEYAERSMNKFKLKHHFKEIYTREKHNALKESGELFSIFIKNEKLKPEECLMIGDIVRIDGVSRKIGMQFCFVDRLDSGYTDDFDYKITSLDELPALLDTINKN